MLGGGRGRPARRRAGRRPAATGRWRGRPDLDPDRGSEGRVGIGSGLGFPSWGDKGRGVGAGRAWWWPSWPVVSWAEAQGVSFPFFCIVFLFSFYLFSFMFIYLSINT